MKVGCRVQGCRVQGFRVRAQRCRVKVGCRRKQGAWWPALSMHPRSAGVQGEGGVQEGAGCVHVWGHHSYAHTSDVRRRTLSS